MPITVQCPQCTKRLSVPDQLAGRRVKCKHCGMTVDVASSTGGTVYPGGEAATPMWTVKTGDGQQFGPVGKAELQQWVSDGRITSDCQLLQTGSSQWQWAADQFPHLSRGGTAIAPSPLAYSEGADLAGAPLESQVTEAPGGVPQLGLESSAAGGKRRPAFRPRKYPAMTIVMYFFYGMAALIGAAFVFELLAMTTGGFAALSALPSSGGAEAGIAGAISMIVMFLVLFIGHGISAALCVYIAESIKIMMDIQLNTQETTHLVKYP